MPFEVTIKPSPISIANGLDPWIDAVKKKVAVRILGNLDRDTSHLDRYLEFAPLAELPGAWVGCGFFQRDLNDALTRVGLFMGAGKGIRKGTLLAHDDPTLVNYKKLVAGHNLPGDVVHAFFRAAEATPEASKAPNEAERAFKADFIDRGGLSSSDRFYVIAFSVQSTKAPRGVFTHEVFHAYHYLLPDYRDEVNRFWREVVRAEDREAITATIGRAYNIEDESLVIDEFQAYLLQERAEADHLRAFVGKYQADLRARLTRRAPVPLPS